MVAASDREASLPTDPSSSFDDDQKRLTGHKGSLFLKLLSLSQPRLGFKPRVLLLWIALMILTGRALLPKLRLVTWRTLVPYLSLTRGSQQITVFPHLLPPLLFLTQTTLGSYLALLLSGLAKASHIRYFYSAFNLCIFLAVCSGILWCRIKYDACPNGNFPATRLFFMYFYFSSLGVVGPGRWAPRAKLRCTGSKLGSGRCNMRRFRILVTCTMESK